MKDAFGTFNVPKASFQGIGGQSQKALSRNGLDAELRQADLASDDEVLHTLDHGAQAASLGAVS